MKPTCKLSADEAFFFEHAGYSYDPARETPAQGRTRCAVSLAAAEAVLLEAIREGAADVDVRPDEDGTRDERAPRWGMIVWARGKSRRSSHQWSIHAASLWCLDDIDSRGYGRVVRAELASEGLDALIASLSYIRSL